MKQSPYIYHIRATQELNMMFEVCDCDITYDNRDKIEDLNGFIRYLNQCNLMTKELEEAIDNFTKFYNN